MVIYETISGNVPFYDVLDQAVFLKVVEGERPRREVCFTETLWRTVNRCWVSGPNERPSIEVVLEWLEMRPNSPSPPSPGVDEVEKIPGTSPIQ